MSINRCVLSGRLTADPELRVTAKGVSVLSFSLCFTSRVSTPDGAYEEKPNYIDATLFGKRADAISKYLVRGDHVSVDGHLSFSEYTKDSRRHTKLQLIVDDIDFTNNKKKN